jgi:tetratricopeptide (TPR) repeat protein
MKCDACGHENLENATFCAGCGKKLESSNKCPQCGFENQPGATFCSGCGESLEKMATPTPTTPTEPQTPLQTQKPSKVKPKKLLLALVAAVLVVAIVVGMVVVMPWPVKATAVEAAGTYQDGMLMIVQDGKYGFMDTNGNIAVPCIYETAYPYENGTAQVRINGGWQEIDRTGQAANSTTNRDEFMIDVSSLIVTPYIYDAISPPIEGLAMVERDDKWGFVDATGKEVIPCIYDYVDYGYSFSEGLAMVVKDDKYGFVDATGKEVVPCIYDYADSFSEGVAWVRKGDNETGKWGFIDATGKEVVPCIYEYTNGVYAYRFSEGLTAVIKGHKRGYVDATGKEVVPCIYDGAQSFSEGLAAVGKVGNYGYIDATGKEVIPFVYDAADSFSEGLAAVEKDGNYGYIDATGKEVVPCIYDSAESFSEGLARVRKGDWKNGKYGFVDATGKEVVPCIYDSANSFSEGLAAVRKDDKYGFVDATGKEVVPCIYDSAESFSEGLARVRKGDWENGKYGFVDATGKELASLTIDTEESFSALFEGLHSSQWSEFVFLLYAMWFPNNGGAVPSEDDRKLAVIFTPEHITDGTTRYIGNGMFTAKDSDTIHEIYNVSGDVVANFTDMDTFSATFAKGAALFAEGKDFQAKKYLKAALKLQPGNPYVSAMLNGTSANTADVPAYNVATVPAKSAGFDDQFREAVALYEAGSPDAQAAMEAVFIAYPQEPQLYSFLADEYEIRGDTEVALSILRYGYEITESQTLRDRFDSLVIEHDLGENSDEVLAALEFAEQLADLTGKGEDFDKGKNIGKEIYEAMNGIRFGS